MQQIKVVKIIVYEGSKEWVNNTLEKSLLNKNKKEFCAGGELNTPNKITCIKLTEEVTE